MNSAVLLGGILATAAGCVYLGIWADNIRRDRKGSAQPQIPAARTEPASDSDPSPQPPP